MDKIKIQEIAEEAGISNNEMLAKARELGYEVKVAGSSVTAEQADALFKYVLTGELPGTSSKKGSSRKGSSGKSDDASKKVEVAVADTENPKKSDEKPVESSSKEKKTFSNKKTSYKYSFFWNC